MFEKEISEAPKARYGPNVNTETGIAFGVTSLNGLAEWVFDEFFNHGVNLSYGEAFAEWLADGHSEDEEFEYEGDEDTYELVTDDGLKLGLSTLGGAYLVWVFESPHVANHAVCSPCCPNAGDIDSEGDYPCYTLPDSWFRV